MANFFNLTLDTTPPSVEVYLPPYTIVGLETEIKIVANEDLSNYQSFWLEDHLGSILYLTLSKTASNEFTFEHNFNIPGIYKLYYQVEDEVGNKSNLSYVLIQVFEAVAMNIITEEKVMNIIKRVFNANIDLKLKTSPIELYIQEQKPALLKVSAAKIEKKVIKIE